MEDRYAFLRTTEHDGKIVALIGDKQKLGDGGVKSIRQATFNHVAARSREGVLTYTKEQLLERLPALQGLPESQAAFHRAIECIDKKLGAAPQIPDPTKVGKAARHGPIVVGIPDPTKIGF